MFSLKFIEILKKFNYNPGQNNGATQRNQTKLDKTGKTLYKFLVLITENILH